MAGKRGNGTFVPASGGAMPLQGMVPVETIELPTFD
jgi:hypothetical protein